MLVKIGKASGRGAFAATLRYLLERSDDAPRSRIVDSNMAGRDRADLAEQLRRVSDSAARCAAPCEHVILRLAPGEQLTERAWREATAMWRDGMGHAGPYVLVEHTRPDGDRHAHLVICRVGFDGRVVSRHGNYARSRAITDRIEERFRLERAGDRPRGRGQSVTRAEYEQARRRCEPPARMGVAARVEAAIRASEGSLTTFVRELDQRAITARVNQSPTTGRIHGLSFEDRAARPGERSRYKGSELGLPWRALERAIEERTPPPVREREQERDRGQGRGRER